MDIVFNKKARFNYEILEDIEAGIVLTGTEVKSLRQKKVAIVDSYAIFRRHELYLVNLRVDPYSHGHQFNHEPGRSRKLLLHKKQLEQLRIKVTQKGCVLFPLKMYINEKGKVKVLIGVGKGKKNFDKRETIKTRDTKREMERDMKSYKK